MEIKQAALCDLRQNGALGSRGDLVASVGPEKTSKQTLVAYNRNTQHHIWSRSFTALSGVKSDVQTSAGVLRGAAECRWFLERVRAHTGSDISSAVYAALV